jgi:hypothetical protein
MSVLSTLIELGYKSIRSKENMAKAMVNISRGKGNLESEKYGLIQFRCKYLMQLHNHTTIDI